MRVIIVAVFCMSAGTNSFIKTFLCMHASSQLHEDNRFCISTLKSWCVLDMFKNCFSWENDCGNPIS